LRAAAKVAPQVSAMTRLRLRLICLLVIVAVLGWTTRAQSQAPRNGRQVYEEACATCHGSDGRGTAAAASDYPLVPPDFTDCNFATREPATDWVAVGHAGGPARAFNRLMPAFGEALSREELELAVSHARSFCAESAWPRGELNLPRALVTTKAFPEDEAVLTVIADKGAVTNKFVWERRIGPRSQFEMIVPLAFSERSAGDWTGGVGDMAFAFKHVVAHSLQRGSIFSAAAEVVVPSGSTERNIGSGTTVLEPFVAYGQRLPARMFVQAQVGGGIPFDRARADEAFWRAAIGQQFRQGEFGRLYAPMIELLAVRELTSGAPVHWDALPQVHVTLSTRQHIRANVGVRVPLNDRTDRPTQVLGYFLWEWFGGGLFTGW
jgi:cbb3-type cytochrome c oxidase subunit III